MVNRRLLMVYDADDERTINETERRIEELKKQGIILKTEIMKEEVVFQQLCDKDEEGKQINIKDKYGMKVPQNERLIKKLANIGYVFIYTL